MSQITELALATLLSLVAVANWRINWRPAWLHVAVAAFLFAILTMLVVHVAGMPAAPALNANSTIALWQQLLVSVWWLHGARLLLGLLRLPLLRERGTGESKLGSDLVAGIVYLATILTIVNFVFDLPVRALLATSGVIAVVLAFALQNTLADVFAGIAVGIERPYVVGDRILIDGGMEGVVVQVNWRSVHIRTDGNDIATIPNSMIAKSKVTNRSQPGARRAETVQVNCESGARPDLVIELLRQATMLSPKILADPAPSAMLTRIGVRANSYDISFSASSTDTLGEAKGMLLRQVLRQFRYHGVRTSNAGLTATAIGPLQASLGLVETLPPEVLLADTALFQDLSTGQRADLATRMLRRDLDATTTLISQGGTDASLFIIASGVLEASRTLAGHSHIIGRLGPGDYFGEIGLLSGAPNAGTILALTRCIVFELRKADLAPLLAAEPELAQKFEASARRGQAFLARDAAAAVSAPPGPPAQFLAQIRAFFKA